jgi:hypothetical protein
MHLEDPETVTGAVALLVSDSMKTTGPVPTATVPATRADPDSPAAFL